MQEGIGLEDLFDFAQVLFGVVLRRASKQDTHVGVDEVFLDGFADGDDVSLQVATRPKVQLATVWQLEIVDLQTACAVEARRHVDEA